jgi:hypothetical protein
LYYCNSVTNRPRIILQFYNCFLRISCTFFDSNYLETILSGLPIIFQGTEEAVCVRLYSQNYGTANNSICTYVCTIFVHCRLTKQDNNGRELGNSAGIFKLLRSPVIVSKESIPPACVAGGPVRLPYSYSVPAPPKIVIKFQHSKTIV